MSARRTPGRLKAAALIALGIASTGPALLAATKETKAWTDRFDVAACRWSSQGRNDYFILEPGYQQVLEGREGKELTHLVITVLPETKKLGDMEARIVEERESVNGEVVEISRNLYALCGPGNDVFYFGEDVDMFEKGKLSGHEGAWTAGSSGARAGLFMPSRPLLGSRYYQEIAPGVAMDRVETMSDSDSIDTPAGSFHDCLRTEETTPIEPGASESKIYAKGVGVVRDDTLLLVSYGFAAAEKK